MNAYLCVHIGVGVCVRVAWISISCLFMCVSMQKCHLCRRTRSHIHTHTYTNTWWHMFRSHTGFFGASKSSLCHLRAYLAPLLCYATYSSLFISEQIFFIIITAVPFAHCSTTWKCFAHNGTFNSSFSLFHFFPFNWANT